MLWLGPSYFVTLEQILAPAAGTVHLKALHNHFIAIQFDCGSKRTQKKRAVKVARGWRKINMKLYSQTKWGVQLQTPPPLHTTWTTGYMVIITSDGWLSASGRHHRHPPVQAALMHELQQEQERTHKSYWLLTLQHYSVNCTLTFQFTSSLKSVIGTVLLFYNIWQEQVGCESNSCRWKPENTISTAAPLHFCLIIRAAYQPRCNSRLFSRAGGSSRGPVFRSPRPRSSIRLRSSPGPRRRPDESVDRFSDGSLRQSELVVPRSSLRFTGGKGLLSSLLQSNIHSISYWGSHSNVTLPTACSLITIACRERNAQVKIHFILSLDYSYFRKD